ncbi:MAG TPA: ABC transporter permease [Pseudonocardiaceae bacterium]|jgi:lipooligosaccharide transport system permease protein|nr:ABC transporter permease [Pseudonocardiaceae bacterium]
MAAETITQARSTGRAVSPWQASMLVIEGHWAWYRRNWKATVMSSVGIPVLYLIAMGLGFGSQVHSTSFTGGLTYLQYIAPGLLAAGAIQNAAGEGTFPILSGFKWQKNFIGITNTPITPGQLVRATFLWIALRMLFSGAVYLLIAAAVGALTSPMVLVSLLFAVLCGMGFAGPVVAFAAAVNDEGVKFNLIFRFIVVPMTLFSGAMFPIAQLPAWVRPVAWITPLWHGTELSRGIELGTLGLWPAVGHIAYLLVLFAVGAVIARARFRSRLAG